MLMGVKLPRKFFSWSGFIIFKFQRRFEKKNEKKKQKKNTDNLIMSIF